MNSLAAYNEKNSPLPVGAVFCFSHLKSISTNNNIDMLEPAPTPIKSRFPADDIYVPDITIISDETIEESKKAASSLCKALGASAPENKEDDLNNDIHLIAKELAAGFQIGDWIVVPYFMQWYPAIIQNVRSYNTIILYFCVLRFNCVLQNYWFINHIN